MKRSVLRALGLTAVVLLSNLAITRADVGDCHISCCDGPTWDGPPPAGTTCCELFGSLCGYIGDAYSETGGKIGGGHTFCPNFSSCS